MEFGLLGQVVVCELVLLAAGTGLASFVGSRWPAFIDVACAVVGAGVAFASVLSIMEAVAAWGGRSVVPSVVDAVPPLPGVTAIVAAYLPNEARLIVGTCHAALDALPRGRGQVVLAYNTPHRLPVEAELAKLAASEPRFVPLAVAGSASKAENVNAALAVATGEIIAVFDADHHPEPGCFERAWPTLAAGADVVQGRCAVRLGDRLPSAIVAAEFEQMYGVSHPGRARLHGFGIFGGSNAFWRADALRRHRLDPTMLTEDIDVSMRVIAAGGRIAVDPSLVSWELPPPSLTALCHQRARWAQGWLEVGLTHLRGLVGSHHLSLRQRAGAVILFAWGPIYTWLSGLATPMLLGRLLTGRGVALPALLLGVVAFGAMAAQAAAAFRNSVPSRRRVGFHAVHLLTSLLVYAELKNAVARVAHLRHALGHHVWLATPRPMAPEVPPVMPIATYEPSAA